MSTNIHTYSTKQKSDLFYIALILLQGLIWGFGNGIVKFAYASCSPLWYMGIRFTVAGFLFMLLLGKRGLKELKTVKPGSWLIPSFFLAIAYATSNVALNVTTATNAGFLMSLSIVFTPFLSLAVFKKRISLTFIPVPIAAAAGLFLLCSGGSGSFSFGWGELLALTSAFAMGVTLVWSQKCLTDISPGTMSMIQLFMSAAVCLISAIIFEPVPVFSEVQPIAWIIMIYIIIFCSIIAYLLQNIALIHISAPVVSLTQCSEPIFTAMFAFLFLSERLNGAGITGAILLTAIIVYGNWTEEKEKEKTLKK